MRRRRPKTPMAMTTRNWTAGAPSRTEWGSLRTPLSLSRVQFDHPGCVRARGQHRPGLRGGIHRGGTGGFRCGAPAHLFRGPDPGGSRADWLAPERNTVRGAPLG